MAEKSPHTLPLEEALRLAGSGLYTKYVIFVSGFVLFAGFTNVQMLAIVIPVAKCDLEITPIQKGLLATVSFAGMTFSSHLFGFLADMVGRRKILLVCLLTSSVLSLLSSLSPNTTTLAMFWFAIGFMTGGLFSPIYVYISEFCPKEIRAKGVLIASAMGALGTGYLPYLASLIVPLKIKTQLIGGMVFSSWRLFITIFPITNIIPMLLLYYLPESPKFTLNEGKEEITLDTLKRIYSLNERVPKEDYPVKSVILDTFDTRVSVQKNEGSHFKKMFTTVVKQTTMLFSREYFFYTTIYSIIMMGILGMYNSFLLWLPDQAKQLKLYLKMYPDFNSTICNVLSHEKEMETTDSCNLNLSAYTPTILVGLAQFVVFIFISTFADKVNKKYIIGSAFLSTMLDIKKDRKADPGRKKKSGGLPLLRKKITIIIYCILYFCYMLTVAMSCMSAAGCIALEYVYDIDLIVLFLGVIITVLISTYPVALSIAVEFYPTLMRSTAASIILLFGRLSIVVLTSVFGYLYHTHCETAYWVASLILIGVAILTTLSPNKRNDEDLNMT